MALRYGLALAAFVAAACLPSGVLACEKFAQLSQEESKELRDKLMQADADPLDRLFAFQSLVCSNEPAIRAYAIREGLKSSSDQLVRDQILLDAMMQKTSVQIKLSPNDDATSKDKEFAERASNLITLDVTYKSQTAGCLSFYAREECGTTNSLFVKGSKVEIREGRMVGEFRLSETNELVGFIKAGEPNFGQIPAVIELY